MADEARAPAPTRHAAEAEIERLRRELAEARQQIAERDAALAEAEAIRRDTVTSSRRRTFASHRATRRLQEQAAEATATHEAEMGVARAQLTLSEDANRELERILAERTAEMERIQETLIQSQKMEAIGQLTGGLAHDFNNLLTGIIGSLELLQTRIAQGRVSTLDRFITTAQGAARRAATLTQRLLTFARRQPLDSKPSDLNSLVVGMEELIRRTMGPGIEVEIVTAVGLWPAFIDAGQLENALLNLCLNARDAMPERGRLTVETANRHLDERAARERDVPPGQYVSLCVSDTGTGMSKEVAARAFDPFYTTKPIGQGTGLGLSMVYGFVRASGGQARIYTEGRQGTLVCLYLPRHYITATDQDVEDAPTVLPVAEGTLTVLVVDDEPTIRVLIAEVLTDLGYTPIEAADGVAALTILQSNAQVDFLITDIGLPNNLNGRELFEQARVLRPELKVLFVTGYAENAVLHHGRLEPGMQVMMKPFALAALAARVQDILGEK